MLKQVFGSELYLIIIFSLYFIAILIKNVINIKKVYKS